tara:strand:+ start:2269 stop:2730 length:462 start_codon:yes stop_codon:yes gene_type:complete
MKIDDNLFAFTSWLMKNRHAETEDKLRIIDGYEWYDYMWNKWFQNSYTGEEIMAILNNITITPTPTNNPETTNMNTPRADLDTVTFTFTQETNCMDGPNNDIETLTVEAKSSLGIDGDGGAFYVLRTEQWAVDGVDEINEIIKRCEKAIKAMV